MTNKERLLSGQPFIILSRDEQQYVLVLEQTSFISTNRLWYYTDRTKRHSNCSFYSDDILELRFGDYEFPDRKEFVPLSSVIFLDLPPKP